ncbi:MAG: DUF2182 domain-containing protein [Pseudolabrys sp.]
MTDTTGDRLTHLPLAAAQLGYLSARPKVIAAACVIVLAALGWAYLGLMVGGEWGGLPAALVDALCRTSSVNTDAATFALVLSMWSAMALAMMLPSAAPMILTYAEIADTAARKGEPIVSPFALASGYAAVWLVFALAAAMLQTLLMRTSLLDAGITSGLFSGAIFIAAGLYQFSALKHACLTQCQQPFPFFFANWATTQRGVFRLGLKQGVYCLGCCWAMMLVMFATGAMNVIWMATFGAVMTIEKMSPGPRFSRAAGIVLIAIGGVFAITAVAGH